MAFPLSDRENRDVIDPYCEEPSPTTTNESYSEDSLNEQGGHKALEQDSLEDKAKDNSPVTFIEFSEQSIDP